MPNMTQSADNSAQSTPRTEQLRDDSRLSRALAWVGIIAGVVFVVAVVFFSGLAVGWYANASGGPFDRSASGGMSSSCPMNPGGMMKSGRMAPHEHHPLRG